MIGRAAVRSPWLFDQIRTAISGGEPQLPTGREVHDYIRRLYEAMTTPDVSEFAQVQRMKKYLNFVGVGIGPDFLHAMRRCSSRGELESLCERDLGHVDPMPLVPISSIEAAV
jgi:tRNA-dihydrouridine synthase